ncbi:cupin [Litorivicinus lipolyticus]|uniref:Cupin n=1 Tax=Litorivicinus lipolyticus TaxID=418701 RepID=A0A5Q2QB30_9GAMM|nr:cupin domain-containing protein [Litorivicinus lipolyticus]QGG79501.1 cupin [Litorivicinus lipolyticus]
MRLRADFDQPARVHPRDYQWLASPMPGVERMMLDRVGDEVARATSLVRYQPGASFSAHTHGGGEEIFVLDGAFGDEHGIYPAGSYLRNPIGTSHTPQVGAQGALIWVKLHQFAADDSAQFVIDDAGDGPLHQHQTEIVSLETWTDSCPVGHDGDEVMVLSGCLGVLAGDYPSGSWIRLPAGFDGQWQALEPTRVLRKRGHLRRPI